MATRALGPTALLLASLMGCGGGGGAAKAAPDPTATLAAEDEGGAAKPKPAAGAAAGAAGGAAAQKPAMKVDESLIPEPGTPITRENYSYTGGGRDPFVSVLEGNTAGPELADLDLVAIYYVDRNPQNSVAVLRDRLNGKRYTVHEGERLGRMRIADIRQKDVTFTIDDYGTERQQTLTLRKQEGNAP